MYSQFSGDVIFSIIVFMTWARQRHWQLQHLSWSHSISQRMRRSYDCCIVDSVVCLSVCLSVTSEWAESGSLGAARDLGWSLVSVIALRWWCVVRMIHRGAARDLRWSVVSVIALWWWCEVRMVTEKFLGVGKVSLSAVFTTMGAGVLLALQLVTQLLTYINAEWILH